MKKILLIAIYLGILFITACSDDSKLSDMIDFVEERYEEEQNAEAENPMAGMDRNEKVLFVLHETYTDHSFTAIEPATDGSDSGIYADENGLEFEVYNIIEHSSYQIQMADDYIYEHLVEQDFFNKAEKIINDYGYEFEFYDNSRTLKIHIDVTDYKVIPEDVLIFAKEILSIPANLPAETITFYGTGSGFSTGEIKYYTSASMNDIYIDLHSDYSNVSYPVIIGFTELKYSDDELLILIKDEYWNLLERPASQIIYKSDLYTEILKDNNGCEVVDELTEKRLRKYMTYNLPVIFEFDASAQSPSEIYFDSTKTMLNLYGFPSDMRNEIEVSSATHGFELSEKDDFMADIESDIKSQIGDRTDVEFVSIEEYPDDDHTVIKVQLNEPFGAISKHYYIMGDGMFALVEQTTFTEEEYYDEVTAELIESFEWEQIER